MKSINAIKKTIWVWLVFCLACCSEVPSQAAAGDWITGRDALQRMMTAAKQWSPDANAIRLFSETCTKPPRGGVCNGWQAIMVSVAKKKSADFYWRGGVVTQGELSDYEPQDAQDEEIALEVSRIKADSDAAFRMSEERGGESLREKNPGTQIRYAMGGTGVFATKAVKQLIWVVIYESKEPRQPAQNCSINAETGDFIQWVYAYR